MVFFSSLRRPHESDFVGVRLGGAGGPMKQAIRWSWRQPIGWVCDWTYDDGSVVQEVFIRRVRRRHWPQPSDDAGVTEWHWRWWVFDRPLLRDWLFLVALIVGIVGVVATVMRGLTSHFGAGSV